MSTFISSLKNEQIKKTVRLRNRSFRDKTKLMIIEGYREITRALEGKHFPITLFYCSKLFLGENELTLIENCRKNGAKIYETTKEVFDKISYRDRPDGLLCIAHHITQTLDDIKLRRYPFIVVAESVEKPGNLGTIIRSSDASGADAVIVCDKCTDINNPNVIRASTGAIFNIPTVDASGTDTLEWLKTNSIQIVATTPHTNLLYSKVDLTRPCAIILGTEQYGLTERWLNAADIKVRIPMLGKADSLNVASAATILMFEIVRQRIDAGIIKP